MQPLDDFEARFEGADFHKGMEVAFSNTRSGGLALRIAGKDVRAPPHCPQHLPRDSAFQELLVCFPDRRALVHTVEWHCVRIGIRD